MQLRWYGARKVNGDMKNKHWIIIFSCAVVILSLLSLWIFSGPDSGHVAGVYQDGELIRTVDLEKVTEPYDFVVENGNSSNTVHVDSDGIRITAASCPDHVCVNHGKLVGHSPIVCLPNKVIIKWIVNDSSEIDVVI